MNTESALIDLLENGSVSNVLSENNHEVSEAVEELQLYLYELGFGRKMRWRDNHATGVYDKRTRKAVKDFARRNNFSSNGRAVSEDMLRIIFKLHGILDDIQQLYRDYKNRSIKQKYYAGSTQRLSVGSLQKLLYTLGYGEELEWDVYRNDGVYDTRTINALRQCGLHRNYTTSGKVLDRKLARKILKELSPLFGKDWPYTRMTIGLGQPEEEEGITEKPTSEAKPDPVIIQPVTTTDLPPLALFHSPEMVGEPLLAHRDFFPALERIAEYARLAGVKLHITSSFRTSTIVPGAIVRPGRMSNHMVGHAIDVNFRYGHGFRYFCNSVCLKSPPLPVPVQDFVSFIKNDPALRWGGDFTPYDPVHIDDHFNKEEENWKQKLAAVQQARYNGLV